MILPAEAVFTRLEPGRLQRRAMLERTQAAFADHLADADEAAVFLGNLTAPVSGAWVYSGNGKSGTSSTRRFLFELEFGLPLSVSFTDPDDANSDPGPHMLARAGVFRALSQHPLGLEVLQEGLRLATARHPTARALSSYHYICLSNERALQLMAGDRFRMNACVGFDWTRDPGTVTGFEKFLDYVHLEDQAEGHHGGNGHLRPQVHNVRPELYRPDLIGRTEALDSFFREIAARLDRPLPKGWLPPESNRSGGGAQSHLLTASVCQRLERTYAADYEWLGVEVR